MDIAKGIITIFVSLLGTYIIMPFLKNYLTKKELQLARNIITDIVAGLESQNLSGADKKELAEKIIKEILRVKKIKIPNMLISALIESSLYFLRKSFGKNLINGRDKTLEVYSVKENMLN